jgi:hypothetical protein
MSPRSERLPSLSMADTQCKFHRTTRAVVWIHSPLFETVNLVAERSEFHKLLPAFTTWLRG